LDWAVGWGIYLAVKETWLSMCARGDFGGVVARPQAAADKWRHVPLILISRAGRRQMEFLLRELTPGENVLAALLRGCARR
jgi:hypothetical protein